MEKELPKIYQGSTNKKFMNNKDFYYGEYRNKTEEIKIDDLFKINEIYRTNVRLYTKEKTMNKTIIGRTQKNLITLDNEIIPILDILKIERN